MLKFLCVALALALIPWQVYAQPQGQQSGDQNQVPRPAYVVVEGPGNTGSCMPAGQAAAQAEGGQGMQAGAQSPGGQAGGGGGPEGQGPGPGGPGGGGPQGAGPGGGPQGGNAGGGPGPEGQPAPGTAGGGNPALACGAGGPCPGMGAATVTTVPFIVPSDKGGVIVLYQGMLYKYDKDLKQLKKVPIGQ